MQKEELCPCKSGKPFGACCEPIITGEKTAETAEALMRARYSAYATGNMPFLKTSLSKAMREAQKSSADESGASPDIRWHGLEIISTEKGTADDTEGIVEFRALYTAPNGEFCNHHERSTFVREEGGWKFVDGEMLPEKPIVREQPKVGRNDPCPCGSGKKFKKCCGKEH